jgi:hypothetical protein
VWAASNSSEDPVLEEGVIPLMVVGDEQDSAVAGTRESSSKSGVTPIAGFKLSVVPHLGLVMATRLLL